MLSLPNSSAITYTRFLATLSLVFCISSIHAAEPKPWVEISRTADRECQIFGTCNWLVKTGIDLRIDAIDGDDLAVLKLNATTFQAKGNGASIRPYIELATRLHKENLPAADLPDAPLRIHFGTHTWQIYIANKLCAELPAAFVGPRSVAIRENQTSAKAAPFGAQKTGAFSYRESFMQEPDGPDPMADWTASGEAKWNLYTAHEDAMINPNTKKLGASNPLLPEYSPNFYSLSGIGKGALVRGYSFLDNLSVSAAVRLQPGTAGVIANWQGPKDYTCLTITTSEVGAAPVLRLIQYTSVATPHVRTLSEQTLRTPDRQWIRLELLSRNNRITARIDGVVVADKTTDLATYGKFGLYCDGKTPARFDDLIVERDTSPTINTLADWRLHTTSDPAPALILKSLFTLPQNGDFLQLKAAKKSRTIGIGPADSSAYHFSARFEPNKNAGPFGLAIGVAKGKENHLRFERTIEEGTIRWALIRHTPSGSKELATSSTPAPAKAPPTTLLSIDLHGELLRLYEDDILVLAAEKTDTIGAAGIWASKTFAGRIHSLTWHDNPLPQFRNRYEKNRNFVKDPYMRHWSSPEGEWLKDAALKNRYWFKGDCHGRIELTLPVVAAGKAVLGAELDSPQGQYEINLTKDSATISAINGPSVLATAELPAPKDAKAPKMLSVIQEGRWCWAKYNGEMIWLVALPEQPAGRRVWIEGFSSDERGEALLDRTNVADYLFTRAPSDWVVNGGTWQITNRFQCQPRWSHMAGINEDGLAAIWTKAVFEGDFCVELYGGIRHDDYRRCGDINLTIASPEGAPSTGAGYSIITTGWDRDHSQLVTRLMRDGKELARSDKYLIPRYREGNTRKSRNPLVSSGRPVHGAWYYLKFRKVGTRLQFWFDNELVFDVEDPKPLPEGRFGIWTYRNEIMVARAKVSAEHIRPSNVPLPNADPFDGLPTYVQAKATTANERTPQLLINGISPDKAAEAWTVKDPVGHSTLSRHARPKPESSALVVTNELGGGPMQLRNESLAYRADTIVGWQFDMARSKHSKLHAWYVIGTTKGKSKAFKVHQRYCHLISGHAPRPDRWKSHGASTVSPAQKSTRRGIDKKDWHPVTVWLPIDLPEKPETYEVQFLGLGVFEPGDDDGGIAGNPPGSWYAIRNFRPIYAESPDIRLDASTRAPETILAIDNQTNRLIRRGSQARPTQTPALAAAARQPNPLNIIRIRMTGTRNFIQDSLVSYLGPANPPAVTWAWHKTRANTIVATPIQQIPDRRLVDASFLAAGLPIRPTFQADGSILFEVPLQLTRSQHPNGLPVSWQHDEHIGKADLQWAKRAQIAPPRLLSISGLPVFESFEEPKSSSKRVFRASSDTSDRNQSKDGSSAWLTVSNNGDSRRLSSTLKTPESLAKYPILGLRHAAGPMVNVSASVSSKHVGRISESKSSGKAISILPFDKTGSWQNYLANLSQAISKGAFTPNLMHPSSVRISSIGSTDQTGLYSNWHIDEVVLGPAVRSAGDLNLTPNYASTEPIARIETATLNGPEPLSERAATERHALNWRTVEPTKPLPLNFDNLADGIAKILIRAVDHDGRTSPITEIPILLDRKAPTAKAKYIASTDPAAPGFLLSAAFNTHKGAPIDPAQMTIKLGDLQLPFHDSALTFSHASSGLRLQINWALLLRDHPLPPSTPLTIANIVDGAGNTAPPVVIPLTIPEDIPVRPVFSSLNTPETVFLAANGYLHDDVKHPFSVKSDNKTRLVRSANEPPYVETRPHGALGNITLATVKSKGAKPFLVAEISHPKISKSDSGRIYLVVRHAKGKETICLNAAAVKEHPDYPRATALLPDTTETWHTLSISLGDVLKNQKIDYNEPLSISISRVGVRKDQALLLRNVWLLAPWGPTSTTLAGYSGSSVKSFRHRTITTGKQAPKWQTVNSLTIPTSQLKGALGSWQEIQLLDKQGNPSTAIKIPRIP